MKILHTSDLHINSPLTSRLGSEAAAIRFAQSLAHKYRLTPEPKSKVQRALALAN